MPVPSQSPPPQSCVAHPEVGRTLMEQAFVQAPSPMLITDLGGLICGVNPALELATGYGQDELRGQHPSLFQSPLQSRDFYRLIWAQLSQDGQWQGEIWYRHKSGHDVRDWLSITVLHDASGSPSHYLGQYSGAGKNPMQHAPTDNPGAIDAITGVPNRAAFIAAADRFRPSGQPVAVLTLDLERFTDLNEHFGLSAGDRLLRQVALRCTQAAAAAGGTSLVGRVGADEFAIAWMPADADEVGLALQALAQDLLDAVSAPCDLGVGSQVVVSAQLGMAWMQAGRGEAAEALLHAAAARQDDAPGSVHRYEELDRQRGLGRALRWALQGQRIGIALQPKVDLRSGALVGLEALARWTLDDGQQISPSEFIPLAERLGLIAELGDCVLEQCLAWQARQPGPPVVAVNFSAPQFHRPDLAERVQKALSRHGLTPADLELELTESILLGDVDAALSNLEALRSVGLHLSIDDFGTGYSSLSYLCRFPIARVKLDRSFIANLCTDPRTLALVRSVIALAHQLGLRCVAEGIETQEQLTLLRCLGCDEGQGYLLSQPLSPEAAQALLQGTPPWLRLFHAPMPARPVARPVAPVQASAPVAIA